MWRALAGSWPPARHHKGFWPSIQPLQILLSEELWPPGAPPAVAGALPLITGNWPGIGSAAPKRKKKGRLSSLRGTWGKGQREEK